MTAILLSGTVSAPQAVAALTFQSEIPAITPVGRKLQVYGRVVNDSDEEIEGFTLAIFARTRRWVMEESTGTWCSNCPLGIYALEQFRKEMPDTFIPIALHTGNDPMAAPDWQLTLLETV